MRAVLLAATLLLAPVAAPAEGRHPEQQLIDALADLQGGRPDAAREALGALLHQQPNFQLARLFHDELVAARQDHDVLPGFGEAADPALRDLAHEARLRLDRFQPQPGTVPHAILQLAPQTRHVVAVNLEAARLWVLQQTPDGLVVLADYYAAMGKQGSGKRARGDQRTPEGIYNITGFLPDNELPELYGMGAFPLDYPNIWDRRAGRTGSGIWLHGVPRDTYVRAPRSSDGCVTLANADLRSLKPYLDDHATPVILSPTLSWVPSSDLARERDTFLARIEDWRARWSSRDTDGYLLFYADDFEAGTMNRTAFAKHKRRVNNGKDFINVKLIDLELFRYPGDEDLMLARFTQDYRSSNYSRTSRKQQFWRRLEGGHWQIVREESR